MKKIIYLLALTAFAFGFTNCMDKKQDGRNEEGKIKVAGLMRTDKETFILGYTEALKKAAAEQDVDLEVYVCNDDAAIQIDQVKTLLTSGVKCFVITPVDTAMTPQIAKIINSRGGTAAFSNIVPSTDALDVGKNFFYASSAEISAGDYQADILDAYFKKYPSKLDGNIVNILYMNGEYGHTAQVFRRQGFMDGMKKRGYTVNVLEEACANWSLDSSKQITANLLEDIGENINAIVCQNDDMALGSVAALIENGYVDDSSLRDTDGDGTCVSVPVLGVDATEPAKQSIKEKKLFATVLQDSSGQASTALELVLQYAKEGTAKDFTTSRGIKAATQTTGEAPLIKDSVLDQCFIVPFVPVTE